MTTRSPALDPIGGGEPWSLRADRIRRHEDTSRALARLLEQHGVTKASVAAASGAKPQHVGLWCDPESSKNIPLSDARAIPSDAVRRALAELLAGPGFVLVVKPDARAAIDDVRVAASIAQGGGAVLYQWLEAIRDGKVTPDEAAPLAARIDEHVRDLLGLRAVLAEVERTRLHLVRRTLKVSEGAA